MPGRRFFLPVFTLIALTLLANAPLHGQKAKKGGFKGPPTGVEALAEKAKASIVVILHTGRQGKQAGLGTGFVIDADGLIATNFHVIGEGRPITVQFPRWHEARRDRSSRLDRHIDLAVIRVNAKGLTPLPLGDSERPQNRSADRRDGTSAGLRTASCPACFPGGAKSKTWACCKIAMPIEQGNSGGPVLDMDGKAVGVVTMKSLVTNNLGFAVPIKDLQSFSNFPTPCQWLVG